MEMGGGGGGVLRPKARPTVKQAGVIWQIDDMRTNHLFIFFTEYPPPPPHTPPTSYLPLICPGPGVFIGISFQIFPFDTYENYL